MGIGDDFSNFCSNLNISSEKRLSISNRYKTITKRLNLDFWSSDSETSHSIYVGSYGRGTAIKGFSDLDLLFRLPYEVYQQYNNYQGNGQSALLQAVKKSMCKTYPSSDIGGDGQIVCISFTDGITFEIVPAFINKNDSYTYPDSNNGGRWRTTNPKPEIEDLKKRDDACNGNLKRLCRMMRAWKRKRDVPMGGLLIDTLAYKFIDNWEHKDGSFSYYDWMVRDFFKYLKDLNDQSYWYAVGSNQQIKSKGSFQYKAKLCYNIACEAINDEKNGYSYSSHQKWREIFGSSFPN